MTDQEIHPDLLDVVPVKVKEAERIISEWISQLPVKNWMLGGIASRAYCDAQAKEIQDAQIECGSYVKAWEDVVKENNELKEKLKISINALRTISEIKFSDFRATEKAKEALQKIGVE